MSYTIRDHARTHIPMRVQESMDQHGMIGDKYPDGLDRLIAAIRERSDESLASELWGLADEWEQAHILPLGGEQIAVPEYALGVLAGLRMAARRAGGDV